MYILPEKRSVCVILLNNNIYAHIVQFWVYKLYSWDQATLAVKHLFDFKKFINVLCECV